MNQLVVWGGLRRRLLRRIHLLLSNDRIGGFALLNLPYSALFQICPREHRLYIVAPPQPNLATKTQRKNILCGFTHWKGRICYVFVSLSSNPILNDSSPELKFVMSQGSFVKQAIGMLFSTEVHAGSPPTSIIGMERIISP